MLTVFARDQARTQDREGVTPRAALMSTAQTASEVDTALRRWTNKPQLEGDELQLQDPASMLAAAVLGVAPGMQVLDLCAAPGGKTLQLTPDTFDDELRASPCAPA